MELHVELDEGGMSLSGELSVIIGETITVGSLGQSHQSRLPLERQVALAIILSPNLDRGVTAHMFLEHLMA